MNIKQAAIVLKGIASQILSMSGPTVSEVERLFNEFDMTLDSMFDTYKITKLMIVKLDYIKRSGSWISVHSPVLGIDTVVGQFTESCEFEIHNKQAWLECYWDLMNQKS